MKTAEPGSPILSKIPESPLGESIWSSSTLTDKNALLQEQANQEELNKDEELLEKVKEPTTLQGKRFGRTPTSPPTTPSNSTPTSSNKRRCGGTYQCLKFTFY